MNNFSITQAGNLTALAGLVVWVAGQFGLALVSTEVEQAIGAVAILVGIITSFINRYQKGDVTLGGFRK